MSWGSGFPTHLGHILWALSYGAEELPGGREVEIPKVVQSVRVSVRELGCGNLLQELPLKVSDHRARFHQGDAGDIGSGRGSGTSTQSLPHYCPSPPLSPHFSHHYFILPGSPSPSTAHPQYCPTFF